MPFLTRVFGYFLLLTAVLVGPVRGSTITLDFEGLADGTSIGSTYSSLGATFVNATAITAGLTLNELEFPPHSGENVATDAGGPITISFSDLIYSFSGYFTYASPLQLTAFDASNAQVDTTASAFAENFVSSGNPPNEFIQLSSIGGIASLTITGDPAGGSFVMDDVTFETTTQVVGTSPEPGSVWLLAVGLLAVTGMRRFLRAGAK